MAFWNADAQYVDRGRPGVCGRLRFPDMHRSRFADCYSLVLAAALLASCSGSTPPVTVTQACSDYANAICQRYSSCSSG